MLRMQMKERLLHVANTHPISISIFLYVLGVLHILLWPAVSVSTGEWKPRSTFISENAIHTHLMDQKYSTNDLEYAQGLFTNGSQVIEDSSRQLQAAAVYKQCKEAGLEAEVQEFKIDADAESMFNVVCTLPAKYFARNDEALVFQAPYLRRHNNSIEYAIEAPFLISLMRLLQPQHWRAKDVVVVLSGDPDNSDTASVRFLQGYQSIQTPLVSHFKRTSGSIRGAVALEMSRLHGLDAGVEKVVLHPYGRRGEVAELDFYTLVSGSMRTDTILWDADSSALHGELERWFGYVGRWVSVPSVAATLLLERIKLLVNSLGLWALPSHVRILGYVDRLKTLVGTFADRLTSSTAASQAFLDVGIPAVGCSLLPSTHNAHGMDLIQLGASLEKITRAMSGTEERLHAGAPSYFLITADLFLGLNELAITAALLSLPVVLLAATRRPSLAAIAVPGTVLVLLEWVFWLFAAAETVKSIAVATLMLCAIPVLYVFKLVSINTTCKQKVGLVESRAVVQASLFLCCLGIGFMQFCLAYTHPPLCILLGCLLVPTLLLLAAFLRRGNMMVCSAVCACVLAVLVWAWRHVPSGATRVWTVSEIPFATQPCEHAVAHLFALFLQLFLSLAV